MTLTISRTRKRLDWTLFPDPNTRVSLIGAIEFKESKPTIRAYAVRWK